jgi:2-keto-4-pentenoate hydratase/2-oxohepta-3-ene-1,7-dioic acid hydratase in catechol pathway
MRICRFNDDRLGVLRADGRIADVSSVVDAAEPVRPWPLPAGDWLVANLDVLRPRIERAMSTAQHFDVNEVKLRSPVANPTKIIAAPVNYRAHFDEAVAQKDISFGQDVKTIEHYGLFLKANSSLVGPSDSVRLRMPERRHDHEGELVVVIGKKASGVLQADALDIVCGYCTGLDMTTRGVEERSLRKSIDTYTVLGPWLTLRDEVPDPDNLRLTLKVNGQVRQDASTRGLIFGVRKLIEYASSFYTLFPGDIIMTGTPDGVGPVHPGDLLDLEIERLGAMRVGVTSGAVA